MTASPASMACRAFMASTACRARLARTARTALRASPERRAQTVRPYAFCVEHFVLSILGWAYTIVACERSLFGVDQGAAGKPGADGKPGLDGKAGPAGVNGKDGDLPRSAVRVLLCCTARQSAALCCNALQLVAFVLQYVAYNGLQRGCTLLRNPTCVAALSVCLRLHRRRCCIGRSVERRVGSATM